MRRWARWVIESTMTGHERRNGNVERNLTTHSTGAESACLSSRTWMLFADVSRPVNSGVMSPLRVNMKKLPAAPQLNAAQVVWIMREVG